MEQLVSNQTKLVNEESKIRRECLGRRMALLGNVMYQETNNRTQFYVSSESVTERYYYVELKGSGNSWCSCPDFTHRGDPCKHILAVGYALHLGLVQPIGHKLPLTHKKVVTSVSGPNDHDINKPKSVAEQYKDLSIATLNELEKAEIEGEAYSRTHRQHNWEDDEYSF